MNCANHVDVERAAFCQNCGKPLCRECMRTVGSAVYCEPCLEAKLASANAAGAGAANVFYDGLTGSVRSSGPSGSASYSGLTGSAQYTASGAPPPPGVGMDGMGGPNPMLAGLLGFIPGVGAMFNGQFVKAVAHIVIFGILVSLADKAAFFGILISGWVFYQVFDAYQTAKARRDGEPLPNPFGLNDLGERIGISSPQPTAAGPAPGAPAAGPAAEGYRPAPPTPGTTGGPVPSPPGFAPVGTAPVGAGPGATYGAGGVPPASPYGYPYPYAPVSYDPLPPAGHPLPIGAIVLIGLGIFFLLGTLDVLNTRWLGGGWPFLLIALGAWIFYSRLRGIGGLPSDGSATYRWHALRAVCFPVWAIVLTGVLALLDSWHVLSWDVGWAFYLIVWGVLALAMRTVTAQMQRESFAQAQAQAQASEARPDSGIGAPAAGASAFSADNEATSTTTEGR